MHPAFAALILARLRVRAASSSSGDRTGSGLRGRELERVGRPCRRGPLLVFEREREPGMRLLVLPWAAIARLTVILFEVAEGGR